MIKRTKHMSLTSNLFLVLLIIIIDDQKYGIFLLKVCTIITGFCTGSLRLYRVGLALRVTWEVEWCNITLLYDIDNTISLWDTIFTNQVRHGRICSQRNTIVLLYCTLVEDNMIAAIHRFTVAGYCATLSLANFITKREESEKRIVISCSSDA